MGRPSAVVFDLGKVLVDFDYGIAVDRLTARSAVPAAEVRRLIDQSALLVDYETGRLGTAGFFERFRAGAGFRGDLEEFGRLFGDIFAPIPAMVRLAQTLRHGGVPAWIFSNTNELAVRRIRGAFPFFAQFDGYVLSYEHGAMKPDPALYAVVERVTGLTGEALFYLDDREENVEAGRRRGWRAVVHRDVAVTYAAVRREGLPTP